MLYFSFLWARVKNIFAQIMTIGPWEIYDVLILLRSFCAIAYLNGIVQGFQNWIYFCCRPNIKGFRPLLMISRMILFQFTPHITYS